MRTQFHNYAFPVYPVAVWGALVHFLGSRTKDVSPGWKQLMLKSFLFENASCFLARSSCKEVQY